MTRSERALGAALVLAAFGCAIDDRVLTAREAEIPLLPDAAGYVNGHNTAEIRGGWTAFSDTLACLATGRFSADQCSVIVTSVPIPSDLPTGRMCASGTAARVIDDPATMQPDFVTIWGAGIQFDFGSPAEEDPYDAAAHMITGISFEIDSSQEDMIVRFPIVGNTTNAPYWGGESEPVSPVAAGLNVVRWADVGGPSYAPDSPPFDEAKLLRIQFMVPANVDHATPFEFCISHLAARTD